MRHFVEWDSIEFRIDGERLAAVAREGARRDPAIERFDITFTNGLIRVDGTVRKYLAVPFSVEITEIIPAGREIRVPLKAIAAAGFPLPRFLVGFLRDRLPAEVVRYEDPATFIVSLDRFLPDFVAAEVQSVWIIEGGLAVTVGRGGADPPIPTIGVESK